MATAFTPPSIAQFQAQFPRDWPYGSGTDKVTPADIQNAINEGYGLFNPALWDTSATLSNPPITGSIVQGSALVSNVSSTNGLTPGQLVGGSGIPGGTTILFVGTNSLTLSANATQTIAGNQLSFSLVVTGNTMINSITISAVSSTLGIAAGDNIVGAGIPAGAIVAGVGVNSLQMNVQATATAAAVSLAIAQVSGFTVNEQTIAYCYLTAHLLVLSLQNSGGLSAPLSYQGAGSSGGGTVESKTVGSVSVTYAIPDRVKNSPTLGQYMRTGYGQKYLQMLAPKIPGRRIVVVGGEPTPASPAIPNFGVPFNR